MVKVHRQIVTCIDQARFPVVLFGGVRCSRQCASEYRLLPSERLCLVNVFQKLNLLDFLFLEKEDDQSCDSALMTRPSNLSSVNSCSADRGFPLPFLSSILYCTSILPLVCVYCSTLSLKFNNNVAKHLFVI